MKDSTRNLENNQNTQLENKIYQLNKKIAKYEAIELKQNRFGLVWLDVPEAFEDDVENKLPILTEVSKLAINNKDGKPTHLLIEGDNYHALTCLNYTHRAKIDIIYIDPPYNTGSDGFKYKDKRILKEYPDGTEVPVDHPLRHSYWLSFMHKRLELAKNLLKPNGCIFSSIDDNEFPRLIMLFEELWGENNVKTISVKMSEPTGLKMAHIIKNGGIPKLKEFIVLAKMDGIKNIHIEKIAKADWDNEYKTIITTLSKSEIDDIKKIRDNEQRTPEDINKCDKILSKIKIKSLANYFKNDNIKDKKIISNFKLENAWRIIQIVSMAGGAKVLADKKKKDNKNDFFSIITSQKKMYLIKNYYDQKKEIPRIKILFADDYLTIHTGDFWQDIKTTGLDNEGGVDFKNGKKPMALIERIIKSVNNPNAIVLDFFAGSGTTAEVVMRLNEKDKGKRQTILITDNTEVVNGKEHRIMTDICYPRVKNTIKGFKNKNGIGNSIRYFKIDFVGKNNILKVNDADRIELAHNAGSMLAIAENTFDQFEQNDYWQIFGNQKQYTAVYFREEFNKFDEFIEKVKKLKKLSVVYIFSWEKELEFSDFDDIKNIKVKTIPQPILEIYKQIYNLV